MFRTVLLSILAQENPTIYGRSVFQQKDHPSRMRTLHRSALQLSRAKPLAQNKRPFVIEVTLSDGKHPVLLDTGSWDFWIEAKEITAAKHNQLVGYHNLKNLQETNDPHPLTYGGGDSVTLNYWVTESVGIGSKRIIQKMWVSTIPSSAFHHAFGTVGTLGAQLDTPISQGLESFYFVPRRTKIEMFVGKFLHSSLCTRNKLVKVPITGHNTWEVDGTVGIENGESMQVKMVFDTGMTVIELEDPIWNSFITRMERIGSPVGPSKADAISFPVSNCENFKQRFPRIRISFSSFEYHMHPRSYVVPLGRNCNVRIVPKGSTGGIGGPGRTVVGTSLLQYVISFFGARERTFGACTFARVKRT